MVKIAHTADIHWRGLSRHDEYREIFSVFVEDCKKNKVDHIFIGGDIFHTKTTGISPEYIEQLTWWLESMAAIAPVHLTLGNHDGNLVNLSRQDAVTPIVQALNNPNVRLYKKSGVYEFHPGYNFCVFSLFDEEGWNSVKPDKNAINIACYHGPVHGSVTEAGWEIEGHLRVEFFNDYPFVLLGDIHKMQHLGYKNDVKGNKKPWISYPGTPIQQNYAEDLDHGYLLWDIKSKDEWNVEFKKLPNIKPYVTLTWSGDTKNLLKEASSFPDGARFRVRSADQLSQKDFKIISESLKTNKIATEVTFKSDFIADRSTVKTTTATLEKADLRNPDVLVKLIKDYYKGSQVSEDSWGLVSENVKKYLMTVSSSEETTRNSKWSIRYLEFDNMFAYGAGNKINFDNLNGIVGIFGPNRAGKSSIVGTLMYSLFNATDRGPIKNIHVCNVRKPYCGSRTVINHNGTDYVVERQTTKSENKKGVVNAATALNVFKIRDDGEADDLAGEQRTDTEKVIRALIGSQEDFMMTSLAAQGEINQFISQGSTKRRAVLSRFLDLDIFDKMHEMSNKELGVYKLQLKNLPEKDWASLIQQGEAELSTIEDHIRNSAVKIKEKQFDLSQLQLELSRHSASPVTLSQVEAFSRQVSSLEEKCLVCSDKIKKLKSEIEENEKKLLTIKQLKDENDIDDLKKRAEAYKKLESSISLLKHAHERETLHLKQQQKSLKILDEVPCGDEYSTCKFIKDAHLAKSKIPEQEKKTFDAKKSLDDATEAFQELEKENVFDRLEKMQKLIELESKVLLEISRKETELATVTSSCSSASVELDSAKRRLETLQEALKNKENDEVVTIRSNIENILSEIDSLTSLKLEHATKKGKVTAAIEKLVEEKAKRDLLLEEMKVHDLITTAFSKKGIPLIITKSQLPLINAEIAKILSGIVDFTVELENDESSDSSEIYINYGDSRRIIELCSGMEKTISSLAIRVAMINVSSLPKADVFIVDEGFGTLDDASVEACNRLLVSLKRYFRVIIVITHVDGIKDVVDHILEITKNEKDSNVVYGVD